MKKEEQEEEKNDLPHSMIPLFITFCSSAKTYKQKFLEYFFKSILFFFFQTISNDDPYTTLILLLLFYDLNHIQT